MNCASLRRRRCLRRRRLPEVAVEPERLGPLADADPNGDASRHLTAAPAAKDASEETAARGAGALNDPRPVGAPGPPLAVRRGRISRDLLDVAGMMRRERVTLGEVLDELGREGLGLAVLVLALPSLIPIPGPFGFTFGTLIAFVALQVMAGRETLWLPGFIRRIALPSAAIRRVIARALPWIAWAERWLDERRMAYLTGYRARILLALPLFLLAVALMLPIPFGNVARVLALVVFAFGFMARDGAAILVALVLSAAALAWTGFLMLVGASILDWIWGWVWGWLDW